jgi:N utilization substance protein A
VIWNGAVKPLFLISLLKGIIMDLKKLPKTEFAVAVAQIAGERNIDTQLILDSIELGLISAYKRDQKEKGIIIPEEDQFTVELSPESGSFRVYKILKAGKSEDVTPPGFGRIAAQTAKQVIDQRIREAEKDAIISDYVKKVGTLIPGIVLKSDPYKVTVTIGKTEGICPKEEMVKNEDLSPGTKKLFLIKEIIQDDTGRRDVLLSRRDPDFVRELFNREVPEVGNTHVVVVEKIARSAGERTKVAVSSNQPGVDPVGSCIGQKGSRIQSILSELPQDEKVDVISYSKNINQFIAQALSPAQDVTVESIVNGVATVSLPENQLALAIGAGGDNVRLAGLLTGYDINVTASKAKKEAKV